MKIGKNDFYSNTKENKKFFRVICLSLAVEGWDLKTNTTIMICRNWHDSVSRNAKCTTFFWRY